ncbi:MAG TPA: FkbM family methyltransferase [Marmoricola sp.]
MEHRATQFYRGSVGALLQPAVERLRGRGLARRHRALWKLHRAIWLATRSNRVQIDGHDLRVDARDSLALAKGWYEPEETAWYSQQVHRGEFVVEAGANIGFFSLMLARQVGPEGKVLCYEPDPELAAILRRNVEANGYTNVVVRQAAVADQPGELTFFRAARNTGDNRLFTHGVDGGSFPVSAVTLDDELEGETRRIDLLKLDIQGAEPLALRGLGRTLRTRPPRRIMMEFWPHGIIGMQEDPRELLESLLSMGYAASTLHDGAPLEVDRALAELTSANEEWVNLVLVHETAGDQP